MGILTRINDILVTYTMMVLIVLCHIIYVLAYSKLFLIPLSVILFTIVIKAFADKSISEIKESTFDDYLEDFQNIKEQMNQSYINTLFFSVGMLIMM